MVKELEPGIALASRLLETISRQLSAQLADMDSSEQLHTKRQRRKLAKEVASELPLRYPWAKMLVEERLEALVRRHVETVLELALGAAGKKPDSEEDAVAPAPLAAAAGCEGFVVEVEAMLDAAGTAAAAADAVLDAPYTIECNRSRPSQVLLRTPELWFLPFDEAYELAHQLQKADGIAWAEPDITLKAPWNATCEKASVDGGNGGDVEVPAGGGGSREHLPESDDRWWGIEEVRAEKAWEYSKAEGRTPYGRGVLIGHPDTGYVRHEQVDSDRQRADLGQDLWRDDPDPWDDMESSWRTFFEAGFVTQKGHGTATSSVIMSGKDNLLCGIAPEAELVPFRVSPTVVLLSLRRLSEAIYRAVDTGCDVISISMGGPGTPRHLDEAVKYAEKAGVIVCAAAGNQIRYWVVSPARYKRVVGVAACNAKLEPWSGTSRGETVSITAPGQDVWRALARENDRNVTYQDVERSSGTSYAVAHVAGVAALWIAHHGGREQLKEKLGGWQRIPEVFRQILATEGFRRPTGIEWDEGKFGSGLIDARAVLQADLARYATPPVAAAGLAARETLAPVHLFEDLGLPPEAVEQRLRELFGDRLEQLAGELELQLMLDNKELYERLKKAITAPTAGAAPPSTAAGAAHKSASAELRRVVSPTLAAALRL